LASMVQKSKKGIRCYPLTKGFDHLFEQIKPFMAKQA